MKRVLAWVDGGCFLAIWALVLAYTPMGVRVWIGCAIAAIGFALWITARLQLGSSFSVRAKARALVTTGLYSKFRNPVYLFGSVAYGGVVLIWGRWIPFLCLLVMSWFQVLRAGREARVLEEAFGEEYRRYRAGTWF